MASGSNRQTQIDIDLGDSTVEIERIRATEALSQLFTMEVDIVSQKAELDILPHLGKMASVTLREDDELLRYFTGYAIDSTAVRETPEGYHHKLTLVPWLWFMSQNQNFAIFQELNTVDILKKVFERAGAKDVEFKLSGKYEKRTYCVQYRESDFNFISRLMEEEGIYYFFRHEKSRHVLVLCDSPAPHPPSKPKKLIYSPDSISVFNTDSVARSDRDQSFLQRWSERLSTTSQAKVTMRDFDFERPEKPLEAKTERPREHVRDTTEIYRYPGRYVVDGAGGTFSDAIIEAQRATRRIYSGSAQSQGLECGTKVNVEGHDIDRLNGDFVIMSTYHSITSEAFRTGGDADDEEEDDFNVEFQAVPAATRWRAPIRAQRPIVHGLETAVITGPKGETIYTDKYGRVKVQFPWDRDGKNDELSSCWVRVSQTGGLGNIIMPRVGHEVLVDFLDGNPDRPMVVGRVFNATHMPVYKLPENKTIALWRTLTYGDTGDYGHAEALDTGKPSANELRFEDKGGHEEVFLHAERDMKTRVRRMDSQHVGHDQEIKVGWDRNEKVGNDEKVEIKKNQTNKIGENQKEEIGKNRDVTVKSDDTLDVKGKIKVNAGTSIEIEAGASIQLKVGGNTIKIDMTGITMEGTMVKITGKAMAEFKSPMTTVKGDGMLIAKGGVVMIN